MRTLRFDVGEVSMREQGILEARVFPHCSIKLKEAKEFFDMVELLTHRETHASIIDISGISGLDKEAREFMIKECDAWGTTAAVAFISTSVVSRIIGNLFLTVSKPNYPVRIFTDSSRARSWATNQYRKRL